MKRKSTLIVLLLLFFISVYAANAQCGVNSLTNAGFETPVQPLNGNNLTGLATFNGWTMSTATTFNVVKTGAPIADAPDNAADGIQFIDGFGGNAVFFQDFTVTGSAKYVSFGGQFSSRGPDPGYINWTGSVNIRALPSLSIMGVSNTFTFTNTTNQEIWVSLTGVSYLTPGNYRFEVNLGDWGNFDAAYVYQSCALPVTLQNFEGNYSNNTVTLNWKAEDISNFSHFEVEKSMDGTHFKTFQSVPLSAGNRYNCTDRDLTTANIYYYRLKMVDLDGKFTYSRIIKISTGDNNSFTILKNPAEHTLALAGMKGSGSVRIVDMTGNLQMNQHVQSQTIAIDISTLRKGMYIVQYITGENTVSKKLIVQ